jgi:hypothetical protein
VLRDYVKSEKHYWDEAAFIPDASDYGIADQVVARFVELRSDDFAGGLVARRFESFTGAEARSWWVDGTCVLVTAHPDTPDDQPTPAAFIDEIASSIQAINSPFCSVDLVRRGDGRWRVIEIGDGQVSGFPISSNIGVLLAALST